MAAGCKGASAPVRLNSMFSACSEGCSSAKVFATFSCYAKISMHVIRRLSAYTNKTVILISRCEALGIGEIGVLFVLLPF